MNYIKATDLAEKQFKFKRVLGSSYKMFDKENNKMLESPTPLKGYSRKWKCEIATKDGVSQIDFSDDLLSKILLDAYSKNCGVENQIIYLKTNGKSGMEIRYYPNILLVKNNEQAGVIEELNF